MWSIHWGNVGVLVILLTCNKLSQTKLLNAAQVYYLTVSVDSESGHGLARLLCSKASHEAAVIVPSEGSTGKGSTQVHMVVGRI